MTKEPTMIAVIEQAVLNPDVDVDKMSRLLDIQERILDKNNAQAYAQAMTAAQAECPRVIHNKQNTQTGSTYSDLDAVLNVVKPIYTKHGFNLMFGTKDSRENYVKVTCKVTHNSGHSEEFEVDVPYDATGPKGNAVKTATHATMSSISYGQRYLVELIFNVSTGKDDDGNQGVSHKETTEHFLNMIQIILEYLLTIAAIRESLDCVPNEYDETNEHLCDASQVWYGLDDEEKKKLWVAPTKGGPFSVRHRDIMKSSAFRRSYFGPDADTLKR